jgi:glycosyltransferase involved in cell wall biosynthesis
MKLLFVARRYPPDIISGTETVFQNLYKLACVSHDVRLVVGYTQSREMVPTEAVAVDIRGKRFGLAHLAIYRAAQAEAKRFQPDAILSNSIEAPITGHPTAVIVHDLNFGGAGSSLTGRAKEFLYRSRCPKFDKVIAVSDATKVALHDIGVADEDIRVIHNGVDLAAFHPSERYALNPDHFTLCFPGRILRGKGQHIAIQAVQQLPDELRAKVTLNIVGTVADEPYLVELRAMAGGADVQFFTEVPDIVPYYQNADLILFPTMMVEGFGFTAIEGMAAAKPVIWTEQPAIREATGGLGRSFPSGDAAALADAIVALLAAPSQLLEIGQKSHAFVTERYPWHVSWAQYEAVLQEIANQKSV